jgi:hypothetical protein
VAGKPISKKRVLVAVAVVLGGALVLASGQPNFVVTFLYVGVYQSLFPSTVSWSSHGAYVKCSGAIADPSQWPKSPAAACQAMHMCANEAALSDSESRALAAHMRATPGCQNP